MNSPKIFLPNGTEVIMDLSHCEPVILNSFEQLNEIFTKAIHICGATILKSVWHAFEPQGLTILYLLSESSFTFHSYPEHGFCSINCYTCGTCRPEEACKAIVDEFSKRQTKKIDVSLTILERGVSSTDSDLFYHKIKDQRQPWS